MKLSSDRIALEYREAEILANEKIQAQKSEKLSELSENIGTENAVDYKKGYADGISDGLRKIHEITAEDRNNLAKIAMISAGSHTTIENMKEINNEFRLTEGNNNKKV